MEQRKFWGWEADKGACAFYRVQTPLGGLVDDDVQFGTTMPNEIIDEPERLVVLQRSTNPIAMTVLDYFVQNSRPWVYDADDLLWNLTPDNPAYNHYSQPVIAERFRWLTHHATLFTVSTAPLAQEAADHGAQRVAVVPNVLPDHLHEYAAQQRAQERVEERTTILWRGSPTHSEDVKVMRYALTRLAKRDDVRLVFAGTDYRRKLGVPEAEFLPWVKSPEGYIRQIIDLAPDIAICPLAHTRFNRSKSHVAALEASLAGAWPVCSDVPAYQSFVNDGVNGHLLNSNQDSWHRTLQSLVDAHQAGTLDVAAPPANADGYRASRLAADYRAMLLDVAG